VRQSGRASAASAVVVAVCALCAAPPATAATARAAPACTKSAARKAVVSTGLARKIRARLGPSVVRRGERVLELYSVGLLICADVTGDGTGEMIVLLQCCTVSAPSPWAIFQVGAHGRWALRYTRIKTTTFGLRVDANGDVEARMPDYAPSDANCCPSSLKYVRAHWTGARFVTLRGQG
jgi:hypothetical protein